MRDATFSIALGHSPEKVFEQLQQELGKAVADLDVHPALKRPLFDRFLDNFLIGYPELWLVVDADVSRFLGSLMIKNYVGDGFSADKSVINGKSGRSLVRSGGDPCSPRLCGRHLSHPQRREA